MEVCDWLTVKQRSRTGYPFIGVCFLYQAKKKMTKMVEKIIESKREGSNSSSRVSRVVDVVDVLLNEQLTDSLIAENMIDMMIPGEDSVPLLITLAVKFLSDSPHALQQLRVRNWFTSPPTMLLSFYITHSLFMSLSLSLLFTTKPSSHHLDN